MTELVTCRLRCPVCTTQFLADEVHGAIPSGRETDFRPVYSGPDPLLSNIHSCPQCRYSSYRNGFETEPSDEDELIEDVEDDPLSLPRGQVLIPDDDDVADLRRYVRSGELADGIISASQEPFGASRYLLAARVREYLYEEDPLALAHYYLRSAWAARVARDRETERRSIQEVLLRASPVFEASSAGDPQRVRQAYLIGELSRRIGDFARAVDLLGTVAREADGDEPDGALLAKLAQRQNMLAFVKNDINAMIPADLRGRGQRAGDDDTADDDDGGMSSLN